MNKTILLHLGEIEKYRMLMHLSLMSLSMSNILRIDVTTIISLVLHINFAKMHTDSKVVIPITLLFGKMLNLMKIFH